MTTMIQGLENLSIGVAAKHGIGQFLLRSGITEDQEGVVETIYETQGGVEEQRIAGVVIRVNKGIVSIEMQFLKERWKFSLSVKRESCEDSDCVTTYTVDTVWKEDAMAWCHANVANVLNHLR